MKYIWEDLIYYAVIAVLLLLLLLAVSRGMAAVEGCTDNVGQINANIELIKEAEQRPIIGLTPEQLYRVGFLFAHDDTDPKMAREKSAEYIGPLCENLGFYQP